MFTTIRSWLSKAIAPKPQSGQLAERREKGMDGGGLGTPTIFNLGNRQSLKKYERKTDATKIDPEEVLRKGLQGDGYFGWTSDHREESEQDQGWVHIALSALSKGAAESKATVVRQIPPDDDSGGQEMDEKPVPWRHPLVQLLRKPNPAYGWAGLMERISKQRGLTGTAFIWGVRSKEDGPTGPPCELYVIPTALVYPAPPSPTMPHGGYRVSASALLTMFSGMYAGVGIGGLASWYTIDARHMIRISKYHSLTEGDGLSPLHANERNIDVATETEELMWSILQNGAFPAGILSMAPNASASADQVKGLMKEAMAWIEANYGGPDRAGKILPAYGLTYQQLSQSLSTVDAELRDQNRNNVFATYGVTPVVAGYQDGGSYSANHAARQQFLDNVVQPELTLIAGILSIRLADHWGEDLTIKIETKPVNDMEFDLKKTESKGNSQAYTVDEVRQMHGDGPHPDNYVGSLPIGAVVPYYQGLFATQQQQAAPQQAAPGQPQQGQQALPADATGATPTDTQGGQVPQFPGQADPMRQNMPDASMDELAGYNNRLKGLSVDDLAAVLRPINPFAVTSNGVHTNGVHTNGTHNG